MSDIRRAAFAGQWYPGERDTLADDIDALLAHGDEGPPSILGLVSPHAGIVYSGPIAAFGYRAVSNRTYDCVVLIGPSHYVGFEGAAASTHAAFASPLGPLDVAQDLVSELVDRVPLIFADRRIHEREHSLELQVPFLVRALPGVPAVPLVMGRQDRETCEALGGALGEMLRGRRALFVASSDLSHYNDRSTASRFDGVVLRHLSEFDAEGLQESLERFDGHACGGGPIVVAMRAAEAHGARAGRVLRYGDSGDVSGDVDRVVGYVSAAFLGEDDTARSAATHDE